MIDSFSDPYWSLHLIGYHSRAADVFLSLMHSCMNMQSRCKIIYNLYGQTQTFALVFATDAHKHAPSSTLNWLAGFAWCNKSFTGINFVRLVTFKKDYHSYMTDFYLLIPRTSSSISVPDRLTHTSQTRGSERINTAGGLTSNVKRYTPLGEA